jgi:hypothetical protein
VTLLTYRVTCRDIEGVEHSVEVTADSLYEAVARSVAALREANWTGDIGRGQTTVTVVFKATRGRAQGPHA